MQFALHQTFAVRELSGNGHKAEFSFKPGEFSPITPATRDVIVRLPSDVSANKAHLDIEYGGQLKQLPEWGAAPDQQVSMDDQINSRLGELANYSVWYPRFYEFSYPLQSRFRKAGSPFAPGRSSVRWTHSYPLVVTPWHRHPDCGRAKR
jgi:hypothetical protein